MMERDAFREFLEGVTAGVVGIIVSTLITLAISTLVDIKSAVIFGLALAPLYVWKNKAAIPAVILASGVLGWILFRTVQL
jgi:chromate transporter